MCLKKQFNHLSQSLVEILRIFEMSKPIMIELNPCAYPYRCRYPSSSSSYPCRCRCPSSYPCALCGRDLCDLCGHDLCDLCPHASFRLTSCHRWFSNIIVIKLILLVEMVEHRPLILSSPYFILFLDKIMKSLFTRYYSII